MKNYKITETERGFEITGPNHSMNGNGVLYHTSETLDDAKKHLKENMDYLVKKNDIIRKREGFEVTENEIGDYTCKGPWEIKGETYTYIEDSLSSADGEGHDVIVKRESDGKFFMFGWFLSFSQNYYFDGFFKEVFPKEVTIITYE